MTKIINIRIFIDLSFLEQKQKILEEQHQLQQQQSYHFSKS